MTFEKCWAWYLTQQGLQFMMLFNHHVVRAEGRGDVYSAVRSLLWPQNWEEVYGFPCSCSLLRQILTQD